MNRLALRDRTRSRTSRARIPTKETEVDRKGKLARSKLQHSDDTKVCSACRESKPRSEFHRNRRNKDGLHDACKSCKNARSAAWRASVALPRRERRRQFLIDWLGGRC